MRALPLERDINVAMSHTHPLMSASEQPVAQALIRHVRLRLRGEGEGGAGLRAAKLRRVSGFQWAFETRTLLAHATESENVDVVRFLVRSGVDPEKLGDE